MKKIYFLGPIGTFANIAAEQLAERIAGETELVPVATWRDVVLATKTTPGSYGVVGYYNYIQGLVQPGLDSIFEGKIHIVGIERVKVKFAIGYHPDVLPEKLNRIYSYPVALEQCSKFLSENFPDHTRISVGSTAAGAQEALSNKDGLGICRKETLEKLGMKILHANIVNELNGKENFTDLYIVSAVDEIVNTSNKMKGMIAITPHVDKKGLLASILNIIACYDINIKNIHSRPALGNIKLNGDNGEPQMFYLEVCMPKSMDLFNQCIGSLKTILSAKKDVEIVRVLGLYSSPNNID